METSGTDLAVGAAAGYVVSITAAGRGAGAGRLRTGVGRHSCFRMPRGWFCLTCALDVILAGVRRVGQEKWGRGGKKMEDVGNQEGLCVPAVVSHPVLVWGKGAQVLRVVVLASLLNVGTVPYLGSGTEASRLSIWLDHPHDS